MLHSKLDPYVLCISHDILAQLRLPTSPEYHIRKEGENLFIGPFIGILVTASEKMLAYSSQYLGSFVADYEHIGGIIMIFSLEGVDLSSQTIRGMFYNPRLRQWDGGTFVYPSAMFSILEASMTNQWEQFQHIYQHLHGVLGSRMFNYPIFDKWEMYQWLRNHPALQPHLPDTILFQTPSDVENMLKRHRKIYVKPVSGRLGTGVMEIIDDGEKIKVKARVDGHNTKHVFHSRKTFLSYIQEKLEIGSLSNPKSH